MGKATRQAFPSQGVGPKGSRLEPLYQQSTTTKLNTPEPEGHKLGVISYLMIPVGQEVRLKVTCMTYLYSVLSGASAESREG